MRRATESAVSSWKPFTSTTPAPSSRPSPYFFQRSTSDSSRLANSSTNCSARALSTPGKYGSEGPRKREAPKGGAEQAREVGHGLVALLLVVAPRPGLPAHRQRRDVLDDLVVGVDVPVGAPHLAVGDDVDARRLHVADGGVHGVVEHLVHVAGAHLGALPRLHSGEPPAGLAVGSDDRGGQQGERGHGRDHKACPTIRARSGRPRKS